MFYFLIHFLAVLLPLFQGGALLLDLLGQLLLRLGFLSDLQLEECHLFSYYLCVIALCLLLFLLALGRQLDLLLEG